MQSQSNDRQKLLPLRLSPATAVRHLLVLIIVASSPLSLPGCDTVAEITFTKENLNDLTALGFRYETCDNSDPLVTCLPPGCGRLDFVLETNLDHFVTPNLQLDGLDGRVTPGTNFGTENNDIRFEKTWLFQQDAKGLDQLCVDVTDCADGFECRSLTDTDLPGNDINIGRQVCVAPGQVDWKDGSLKYIALGDNPQPSNSQTEGLGFKGVSLAINMDNSGSLIGKDETGFIDPDTATDLSLDRFAAMKVFRAELLDGKRSNLVGRSELAIFELSGGAGGTSVTDVFTQDNSFKRTFITDSQASATRNNRLVFEGAIDGLATDTEGTSPLWDGLIASASAFSKVDEGVVEPGYARRALLFADSVSDGSAGNITEANVIAAFTDDRVSARATIVHLDSMAPVTAITKKDPANTAAIDAAKALRTGPVSAYNALACATGGYYVYDVWPKSLPDHLRRLGRAFEGVWSIEVGASILVNGQTRALSELPPGWYRLSANMSVSLGDRTETFNFSAQKIRDVFQENSGAYTDSRLLFEVK